MSSEKPPVRVSDRGEDYEIHVDVANDCTISVACRSHSGATVTLPRMTPFEASMLAKAIDRAAERADTRG